MSSVQITDYTRQVGEPGAAGFELCISGHTPITLESPEHCLELVDALQDTAAKFIRVEAENEGRDVRELEVDRVKLIIPGAFMHVMKVVYNSDIYEPGKLTVIEQPGPDSLTGHAAAHPGIRPGDQIVYDAEDDGNPWIWEHVGFFRTLHMLNSVPGKHQFNVLVEEVEVNA